MMHCLRCSQLLRRSTGGGGMSAGLPEGSVVLACMGCRQFSVEGSGRWVGSGEGMMEALRLLAGAAKQERDATKEMMESSISDPRWEELSWM